MRTFAGIKSVCYQNVHFLKQLPLQINWNYSFILLNNRIIYISDNLIWPLDCIVHLLLTVLLLAAFTVIIITILAGFFNLDMKFSSFLVSGELKGAKHKPRHCSHLPSTPNAKKVGKPPRPTNLSLFPAPPSPFR